MYKCTAYFMFYLVNFSKEKKRVFFFCGFYWFFSSGLFKKNPGVFVTTTLDATGPFA